MPKILREFRDFAIKGNMMDLAIGVIIGGAFSGIVSSLVGDIVMPVISLMTGKMDFSNLFIAMDGSKYATLAAAQEAGAATLNYGVFLTKFIDFLLIALVVFFIVKGINRLRKPRVVVEAAPTTKKCPYCMSEIAVRATRCPHCTSELDG